MTRKEERGKIGVTIEKMKMKRKESSFVKGEKTRKVREKRGQMKEKRERRIWKNERERTRV